MANRTDSAAVSVHGTNPQFLVETITRQKIHNCRYWKEKCFGLTAESIVDEAVALDSYGGTYGAVHKPCPFLCLVLKLLQLQPEKEIIIEYIKDDEFKYLRMLGVFYLRMTGSAKDVFQYLEPILNDYRKIRVRTSSGSYTISHVDDLVDELLTAKEACGIALPFLTTRHVIEERGDLPPRQSLLEMEIMDMDGSTSKGSAYVDPYMENMDGDDRQYRPQSISPLPSFEKKVIDNRSSCANDLLPRSTLSLQEAEIVEANALRLKLGLKPLRL